MYSVRREGSLEKGKEGGREGGRKEQVGMSLSKDV